MPPTYTKGNNVAYTKPILVLTNNFSASAAEMFSATLQDAKRITVYAERGTLSLAVLSLAKC